MTRRIDNYLVAISTNTEKLYWTNRTEWLRRFKRKKNEKTCAKLEIPSYPFCSETNRCARLKCKRCLFKYKLIRIPTWRVKLTPVHVST